MGSARLGGERRCELALALRPLRRIITKKTVESHLGNAYRKLGINSRAGLAGALTDRDEEGPG